MILIEVIFQNANNGYNSWMYFENHAEIDRYARNNAANWREVKNSRKSITIPE